MMPSNLPLSALRGFEAAGRLSSFTLAAHELNLTQSAISHQISSLEDALGQPLFVRANRAIHLTDAGVDFLRITRDVLNRLESGVAHLRAYSKPGSLIVAAPHDFASCWLLRRLPNFRAAHPDIDVWLYTTSRPINLDMDEVDVAISYSAARDTGRHAQLLLEEPVAPVCSPDFAVQHKLEGAADIADATLIHDERALGWSEWCAAAGVSRRDLEKGLNFSDSGLALAAAADGQGLALGGLANAADALEQGRLTVPFGPAMQADAAYYLAVHPEIAERDPVVAFVEWITTEAAATRDAVADLTSRLDHADTADTAPAPNNPSPGG